MAKHLRRPRLRTLLGTGDVDAVWATLAARPYAASTEIVDQALCDSICPGEADRILRAAATAVARRVDLLGSGEVELGRPIDWLQDSKSGARWNLGYGPRQNIAQLDKPSDVKFPWELSRLQWLIPVGQAYLLTGNEEFATAARAVLDEWIDANPYALTVNWAIAMEPALRILTWTWLFHIFARSPAWSDRGFRERFLATLFAHGDFVERHLERSDVNGNHYLADATGLVFAGLFFGAHPRAERWSAIGWKILTTELFVQVHTDGVDFESSTAYQRLTAELFLLPAIYRMRSGLEVGREYRERLCRMAAFVASYSRIDGSSPLWGDADNGRALPFGSQDVNDHRYIVGLVADVFSDDVLLLRSSGPRSEALWLLGTAAAASLPENTDPEGSAAFPKGGAYVMRSADNHLFVDCGPVGMSGRGGHGHNDCLSFELSLLGTLLVTDPGTFVYTASREWRNLFRSTAFHNTPVIDDEEQNRLVHADFLWALHDDAKPSVRIWRVGARFDVLSASHSGYTRIPGRVEPRRTFVLDKLTNSVVLCDQFVGEGLHSVRIPFHFPASIRVELNSDRLKLTAGERRFIVGWHPALDWQAAVRSSWVSPSYGVRLPAQCLELSRAGDLRSLFVLITPDAAVDDLGRATRRILDSAEVWETRPTTP